jgi:hypothetical protein
MPAALRADQRDAASSQQPRLFLRIDVDDAHYPWVTINRVEQPLDESLEYFAAERIVTSR